MSLRHLLNLDLNLAPLYDTPDDAGGGGGDDSLSRDLADLEDDGDGGAGDADADDGDGDGEEGEDERGKKKGKEVGEEDDEDDKEKEGEDEEEEKKDDEEEEDDKEKGKKKGKKDEEDVDDSGRPTVKALKTAFPDIFKKFPYLRTAFFEHSKFAEVFPDPEAAQVAASKAEEYDILEEAVARRGDASFLIETLSENNPKSLNKLVEGFPEAVREKGGKDLYTKLATPIIEELLFVADRHAKKIGAGKDEPGRNLLLAARHLANFVFANGGEIPETFGRKPIVKEEPSEAEVELQEEREAWHNEKRVAALQEVEAAAESTLDAILEVKLDTLTSFERKAVVKDARREIDKKLRADVGFQRMIGGLWRRAAEDGYSDGSKTKIRRAWLDRARAIAPGIRNRLRQEALDARTPGKGDSDKDGKKRQFTNQGGRPPKASSGVGDPKKINWRKTSDMDILNS